MLNDINDDILRKTDTIAFIGDIDNNERYNRLVQSLRNIDVRMESPTEEFFKFNERNRKIILTYNGNLNDKRFSSHEIKEDIIRFFENLDETKYLINKCLTSH